MTTQTIVKEFLLKTRLSMRKFSKSLGVSHSSVAYWAAGKAEPDTGFLITCQNQHQDWRKDFANAILSLRFPNAWQPVNGNGHDEEIKEK